MDAFGKNRRHIMGKMDMSNATTGADLNATSVRKYKLLCPGLTPKVGSDFIIVFLGAFLQATPSVSSN